MKCHIVNILVFVGRMTSGTTINFAIVAEVHRKHINEWAWLCFSETLHSQAVGQGWPISYDRQSLIEEYGMIRGK